MSTVYGKNPPPFFKTQGLPCISRRFTAISLCAAKYHAILRIASHSLVGTGVPDRPFAPHTFPTTFPVGAIHESPDNTFAALFFTFSLPRNLVGAIHESPVFLFLPFRHSERSDESANLRKPQAFILPATYHSQILHIVALRSE